MTTHTSKTSSCLLLLGLAACAGHQPSAQMTPLPAPPPAARPAVVAAPAPGPTVGDTVPPAATVRSEDVEREAVRLFGPEGREIVGAKAVADDTSVPTFDIDVTSYAANRRVLEYLEFFQVDARDRMAIWL
ncbi:MAG: hypothetical protein ACM368_11970, partial [Gemmatimonadota bacterium]